MPPASKPNLTVAVVAHCHPRLRRGGAEILAYRSFRTFKAAGHRTRFFATVPETLPAARNLFSRGQDSLQIEEDEFLLRSGPFDDFLKVHASRHVGEELLRLADPVDAPGGRTDVFHFHHFHHVGLDTIGLVRATRPDAAVGLTFHDYMALCHRDGAMVKRPSNELCHASNPLDCHVCFPEFGLDDFRVREALFGTVLRELDFRTAPSRFLIDRLASRFPDMPVSLVENAVAATSRTTPLPPEPLNHRFAYFGQAHAYKGIDVFLRAAALILEQGTEPAEFHLFGVTEECLGRLKLERLAPLIARWPARIVFRGPYGPDETGRLMQQMGWIVMPSIWWENSPLVLQEALAARRPVICADIGGMAEKVQEGVAGHHFRAGDPADLAATMLWCCADEADWRSLASGLPDPAYTLAMNREFLGLYEGALSGRREGARYEFDPVEPARGKQGLRAAPAARD